MHQIFTNALEALEIEINALKSMRTRMGTGEDIVQAVQTILSTRGRAVVLGMGKSGIVGQKIAATLASTGTPAFFVHPGEAFHGDLGMIKPSDIAILISNSGETEEIIRILPFLGEQKNKVIGLTGNINSTLAKFADVILDVGAEREACNNNLAPTSSTTCTLVMGDVLAVALSKERGFMPEDFARFHPGGSLGRKLLTRVIDVMHRNLPMVTSGATLKETVLAMTEGRLGVALVMESSGKLKGLFTDGDLRRALMKERVGMSDCVDVHMTQQPLIIEEDVRLVEAETLMRKHKVRCLVVMDGKSLTPVGLVELFDF
jgi:arabinose-5-phosphate isomerase